MTDEERHDAGLPDQVTGNISPALTEGERVLVAETGGLAPLSGTADLEAVAQDNLVTLAREVEAEADEAPAERWDEPANTSAAEVAAAPRHVSRDEAALNDINAAIASYPEAASNYVFRGELLLKIGEFAAAEADFQRGLELAAQQVKAHRWGIVAQAVQDRAYVGLKEARKKQGL
ncbi:MAG: hypothetical protein IAE89_15290 [Anaerolineae bacterium]|nr:hypothetical protein [Anaerolineae bacterium]